MDPLLRRDYFKFSIDEIFCKKGKVFSTIILPDINSDFFPPFHTRTINVTPSLLSKEYLMYVEKKYDLDHNIEKSHGSVIQGGYYKIPTGHLIESNAFNEETVIDGNNDIFRERHIPEPPYYEKNIRGKDTYHLKEGLNYLSVDTSEKFDSIFLYCFYVGQGDSSLLICSNGNSYLIDTNLYGKKQADKFIEKVKDILNSHGLDENSIKGLIITHKHIDHLRGSKYIIESGEIKFDNFLINLDYIHPTKSVYKLLEVASQDIPTWININEPGQFNEGITTICITNPDNNTSMNDVAPDLNDSSICLCIRYQSNLLFLTGDAGSDIILNKYQCQWLPDRMGEVLKVSHHGSRTGTNQGVANLMNPRYSFISAGNSKRYKHPHNECIQCLNDVNSDITISKEIKLTSKYVVNNNGIYLEYI